MKKQCTLLVKDFVNVRFKNLDPVTSKKLSDALRFDVPNARHMPSYKLGRWDGTVSFCTAIGNTYLNLVDRLLPILDRAGYEIEIEDNRPSYEFEFSAIDENLFAHKVWPEGHNNAGQPIILRDYQVEAIKVFTENLQSVQEISTAAGKTIILAALSALCEPYGKTIVIVPNKSLVVQTAEDYANLELDYGVYYGDKKEIGHKHTLVTWQSLASLEKSNPDLLKQMLKDVICVICDECHSSKATVLKSLLTKQFAHVPIRFGLTGTVPLEEHEFFALLAGIGSTVNRIKAVELQERGFLSKCHIEIVQIKDDYIEFESYDDEHKYLVTDPTRLEHISKMIREWSNDGNTLVLVERIETGEFFEKLIPNSVFISGDTKVKDRQVEYKAIQQLDNRIIIATFGVASVGVNAPRLFNLVLLEVGKSNTRILQAVGRTLRKAHDKDFAQIYDVCSTMKFSRRHLSKRKTFYNKAEYPCSTRKVSSK